MTPADIAALRGLVDGFRGRFFFDAERGDLVYIDKLCDDKACECERHVNSDGDQDCSVSLGVLDGIDDVMEPIARMLNALPLALDRIEQLEREVNRARALLPTCSGTWLSGSGGHRRYARDCAEPGIWDVGGRYVCDQHKNDKGSDDDAWQWHKERDLLVEMAGGESIESVVERALIATTARDRLAREVAEATADVANLRAGHCLAVIPETFIACGEGGNYCSETCRLRALLAEAVEIARTLGDQAEANADRDDDGWMSQYVNISTRLAVLERLCAAKEEE